MVRGEEEREAGGRDTKRRRKADGETTKKSVGGGGEGEPRTPSKEKAITDTFQASLEHEAAEARGRTEEEDQQLVATIVAHIRTAMKEILKLKAERPEQWAAEVEERKAQVLMLGLSLRRLGRVQKVRVRDARERTAEARLGVDGVTLQLQNLLYEVAHLKKEVRRCLDFQSADQEFDLLPVDQFYKEAPEDITRPAETADNPHKQRLARLQWELVQRRDQTQLFDKLTEEKEAVSEAIAGQERRLASLAPRINTILEATRPLQAALDLPLDARREQQRVVQLLPCPLYTLWVQVAAYAEAFDASITVEVLGDAEAARKLIMREEEPRRPDVCSESDNEQEPPEENLSRKKRSQRPPRGDGEELEDVARQTLSLHPLCVRVTVPGRGGNSVAVAFHYMQALRVITAKCSVHLAQEPRPALTDVIGGDSLLRCLVPGDDGAASPNPANHFTLTHAGITLADHLAATGRPYRWAQHLGGLTFSSQQQQQPSTAAEDSQELAASSPAASVPSQGGEEPVPAWQESAQHVPSTIQAIRRRLQARLALHAQLVSLETATTTTTTTSVIALPATLLRQHFPGKVCSELRSWRPLTWEAYQECPATRPLCEAGLVTPQHLLFLAVFERRQVALEARVAVAPEARVAVTLEARVAVAPDHPSTAPLVALALRWEGVHHPHTLPQLRQMEREVNVHWEELAATHADRLHLLPLMLYRLAVCLDVLTEAASAQADPDSPGPGPAAHFHKEKIFFRPARGPDRAFPFKYHPKLGVFSQR